MTLKNKNFTSSFLCLFIPYLSPQKKAGFAELATPFSCFQWLKA
jgi:hypothetical protein